MEKDLSIVMPVYNEESCIEVVVEKWVQSIRSLNINFDLNIYNDGSRDRTLSKLELLAKKFNEVKVHDKINSGHGPTVLVGYRNSKDYEWVFQVDSDDELSPDIFPSFWEVRQSFDFLVGKRYERNTPWIRKFISFISQWSVWIAIGNGVFDVNCPYRLMRNSMFQNLFFNIPDLTFAPNLIISGYAARKKLRIYEVPVRFQSRKTGEVSIKKLKLLKAAIKSFFQTLFFSWRNIKFLEIDDIDHQHQTQTKK